MPNPLQVTRSCVLAVFLFFYNAALATEQLTGVVTLDRHLGQLIEDFNRKTDQVRLVFIVGPTCPVCKRGLKEMSELVLPVLPPESELSIFIVHVPALEANRGDIAATFDLFDDSRATHYWDDMGTSGIRFQRTLGLPSYAWDVWMIYAPGEKWDVKDPPQPQRWWHQLKGVSPEHRLDSSAFLKSLNSTLLDARSTVRDKGR